jgi:hypothetical protein
VAIKVATELVVTLSGRTFTLRSKIFDFILTYMDSGVAYPLSFSGASVVQIIACVNPRESRVNEASYIRSSSYRNH